MVICLLSAAGVSRAVPPRDVSLMSANDPTPAGRKGASKKRMPIIINEKTNVGVDLNVNGNEKYQCKCNVNVNTNVYVRVYFHVDDYANNVISLAGC